MTDFINDYIVPIATLSIIIFPVCMLLTYALTFDFVWIFAFSLILLSLVLNFGFKKLFNSILPLSLTQRPRSSDTCCTVLKKGCNLASKESFGNAFNDWLDNGSKKWFNGFMEDYLDDLTTEMGNILTTHSISQGNKLPSLKNTIVKYFNMFFGDISNIYKQKRREISNVSKQKTTPGINGMPSGHAQIALLFASFFSLYIYTNYQTPLKYIPISAITLVALFILWSRNYLGCHTPLQVFVGGFIGILVGIGGYIGYTYAANALGYQAEKFMSNYMTYVYFGAGFIGLLMIFTVVLAAVFR